MNRYKAFFLRQGILQAYADIRLISRAVPYLPSRQAYLERLNPPVNRIAAQAYARTIEKEILRTQYNRSAVRRFTERLP